MSAPGAAPALSAERQGFCTPPDLAELIRNLYLEERTGTLNLSRSGVEKRVLLDRGMVLAVTSSLEDEHLTTYLLQRGVIRENQAAPVNGLDDRQAAQALLKSGDLNVELLTSAVRDLAQQALTAVFRWEELEYRFLEEPLPEWPIQTNAVVSFELIIRAIGSMAGFEAVRDVMLRQERALSFSDQIYLPFQELALSPIEGYLISRIDGRTRPREILAQTPPSEEGAASRFLFGLLILGLVQFNPPIGPGLLTYRDLLRGDEEKRQREERETRAIREYYALARDGDPAALLGVPPDASEDLVKQAYHARKERYEPGRFLKGVQVSLKEELQIIEARLLESYLALRSNALEARKRQGSPPEQVVNLDLETMSIRKELAKTEKQSVEEQKLRNCEMYLARAREYFKVGDFFSCIRYCEFAQAQNPNAAEVWGLLGQALSRNPDYRWQKRAETALTRAAELEPFNASHRMVLGEFYRSRGLLATARKHYQRALDIDPSHGEAKRALEEVSRQSD